MQIDAKCQIVSAEAMTSLPHVLFHVVHAPGFRRLTAPSTALRMFSDLVLLVGLSCLLVQKDSVQMLLDGRLSNLVRTWAFLILDLSRVTLFAS